MSREVKRLAPIIQLEMANLRYKLRSYNASPMLDFILHCISQTSDCCWKPTAHTLLNCVLQRKKSRSFGVRHTWVLVPGLPLGFLISRKLGFLRIKQGLKLKCLTHGGYQITFPLLGTFTPWYIFIYISLEIIYRTVLCMF